MKKNELKLLAVIGGSVVVMLGVSAWRWVKSRQAPAQ